MNIKIFGERNTSTNALTQIIRENSSSIVHPGAIAEMGLLATKRTQIERRLGASKQRIEDIIDKVFDKRPIEHQWKHCATNFSSIDRSCNTHFIFTIRHPLSWLISLHKNPYHCLIELPNNLNEFSQCQWKTVGRERLDKASLTPIKLYENKISSYLSFIKILESKRLSYTVLKFEDLIIGQRECFENISPYLDNPSQTFSEVTKSTKESDKNLDYYKVYYGRELWKEKVDSAFLDDFCFNDTLLNWMNYSL